MADVGDKFTDAIAFARSVLRDDWAGVETLLSMNPEPLDLLVPMAWILNATIAKLATQIGMSVDEVWMVMLHSVEQVGQQMEDEGDDES